MYRSGQVRVDVDLRKSTSLQGSGWFYAHHISDVPMQWGQDQLPVCLSRELKHVVPLRSE